MVVVVAIVVFAVFVIPLDFTQLCTSLTEQFVELHSIVANLAV